MGQFDYFQPTQICFGPGRVSEVGEATAKYGKKCLIVTDEFGSTHCGVEAIKKSLSAAGVSYQVYSGVVPNPTTDSIAPGAVVAQEMGADVVLGYGGGSSMDTAKAIAVEATHEGSCWDYLFFKKAPTEATLPVIAVSTTSGTGSQVTQVSVVTETATRTKSALYNPIIFPKVAVVDPELMLTLPLHMTACTGFDAFCHAFEAYLHCSASPLTDSMAVKAIELIVRNLPKTLEDLQNLELRSQLAAADTLAGLCIANAGVTLPHGMGMAISGMYPQVAHGESLAIVYPAFMDFTWRSAVGKFASLGRILSPEQALASDVAAAEQGVALMKQFINDIGMSLKLSDFDVPREELPLLTEACMVLPDYENNPRVATPEEMAELVELCF